MASHKTEDYAFYINNKKKMKEILELIEEQLK